MNESYLLMEDEGGRGQDNSTLSFIGGKPRLPASMEIPVCTMCGATQTFFFQVTFPEPHFWGGLTMAVFACTCCAHEDFLIPEMLQGTLHGAVIPEKFLETYQRNFRVLVFESRDGIVRDDYVEKVRFKVWKVVRVPDPQTEGNKIGGQPNWYLEDESPASYGGVPLGFLMQMQEEFRFEKLPSAPPQVKLDFAGKPKLVTHPYYSLFLQNNVYFFGTCDRNNPHVYILTQI